MRTQGTITLAFGSLLALACSPSKPSGSGMGTASSALLFVTQVPVTGLGSVASPFGNHRATIELAPRGGDLWIRYSDGTLRNLTEEAGFGDVGQQGANAIAVRDPAVHSSGKKALFAMAIGAPPKQFQRATSFWQIYEVSGFGQGETVAITKVTGQPESFNNISPIYASDDRILFTSDRPRSGEMQLYPQRDEYESSPTVAGLYRLAPATGELEMVVHAASGLFNPILDSFGRVLFTQWDHLQRDQQADADRTNGGTNGSFDFADESDGAAKMAMRDEVFPEPRSDNDPLIAGTNQRGHTFNQFFPWEVNEDGSDAETLNHIGRHEWGGSYSQGSFKDDPNIKDQGQQGIAVNELMVRNDGGFFHLREDPKRPGTFLATNANEFGSNCAGGILRIDGDPSLNPEQMRVLAITNPAARNASDSLDDSHTGRYRDPMPLADGTIIVSHTDATKDDARMGAPDNIRHTQNFRLKTLVADGDYMKAGEPLTPGITKKITWWSPDQAFSYDGPLWELQPVEVRESTKPSARKSKIDPVEKSVLDEVGIDESKLRAWLKTNELALIVSRNVTMRDRADVQQPYNLRVPGGVSTAPKSGKIYDVAHFQIFQGDQIRGYGGTTKPEAGRRVLAQVMHDPRVENPATTGPAGSVQVALDGSTAAFIPARRVMTWQLTAPDGSPVVRERAWVSFAPGEIRTCAVCHGLNTVDQAGAVLPTNKPDALRTLMQQWKALHP